MVGDLEQVIASSLEWDLIEATHQTGLRKK